MPLANLPMMFAVAGATSSRSMLDASEMCSISEFAPGSNWLVSTLCRVMASKVSSPTNRFAARVITATTSWPCFWRPRATSTDL